MRAGRVCSRSGCGTIVDRSGRCSACATAADRQRGTAADRGYGRQWLPVRRRVLALMPYCVECGKIATVVDHIDGLGPLGPRGYDLANLRAMCATCHGRRTAQDQPGGWNTDPAR